MASCLEHRGPDATGHFIACHVALGHTRLKILDLSDNANQPMHSNCERYVIVYNGEVYNFRELAAKYSLKLKTGSDTEVILELFAKNRTSFIHELNGMFAFAIYDKQEKQLFLFRDRMGIKPLFYYRDETVFAFASELKSLLKFEPIKNNLKINHQATGHFLHLGYVPEPLTIYEQIVKFPAGHVGHVKICSTESQ